MKKVNFCTSKNFWHYCFLFVLFGILATLGCNNGGHDSPYTPPPPPKPAHIGGIWEGPYSSSLSGFTTEMSGIVSEDREACFSSTEDVSATGDLSVYGNTVSGYLVTIAPSGYYFVDGSDRGITTIEGTVIERQSIEGSYSGLGDEGTFSFQYNNLYERDSHLSLLEGTWSGEIDTDVIEINGAFTRIYTDGSSYKGTISIIDPNFNCYRIQGTGEDANGEPTDIKGLLYLYDAEDMNDGMRSLISFYPKTDVANTSMNDVDTVDDTVWSTVEDAYKQK